MATPLLWLAYFSEFLTYMTFAGLFAVILEDAGLQPTEASQTFSYAYVAAMIAILALARPVDAFGPKAALVSVSIAIAALVYLGTPGLSVSAITIVAIIALACSSATHQSLNGIVGGFYPTIIRGNGVGYASGWGRIAAMIGPLIASIAVRSEPVVAAIPYLSRGALSGRRGTLIALERLQKKMRADGERERIAVTPQPLQSI